MPPTRADREEKTTDASKLSFPIQMVIMIVGAFLSAFGAMQLSTSTMKSDIRDMRTRLEMQSEVDKASERVRSMQNEVLEKAMKTMDATMVELKQQSQLHNLQITAMQGTLAKMGAR